MSGGGTLKARLGARCRNPNLNTISRTSFRTAQWIRPLNEWYCLVLRCGARLPWGPCHTTWVHPPPFPRPLSHLGKNWMLSCTGEEPFSSPWAAGRNSFLPNTQEHLVSSQWGIRGPENLLQPARRHCAAASPCVLPTLPAGYEHFLRKDSELDVTFNSLPVFLGLYPSMPMAFAASSSHVRCVASSSQHLLPAISARNVPEAIVDLQPASLIR
jgi:hypothetical protein